MKRLVGRTSGGALVSLCGWKGHDHVWGVVGTKKCVKEGEKGLGVPIQKILPPTAGQLLVLVEPFGGALQSGKKKSE